LRMTDEARKALAADVDEYGELDRQLRLILPKHEALKKKLSDAISGTPADQIVELLGRSYVIQFGAREFRRTIFDAWKAWRMLRQVLGLKELVELITIPLGAVIDHHLPDPEPQAKFLTRERTGPRSIKVLAMAPPAVSKAA